MDGFEVLQNWLELLRVLIILDIFFNKKKLLIEKTNIEQANYDSLIFLLYKC